MSRLISAHQSKRPNGGRYDSGAPQASQQRGGPRNSSATNVRPYRTDPATNVRPYRTDPVCNICSSATATIRHVHVSSEYDRRMAVKAGKSTFYCIACGRHHGTAKPARRRLLLTSSTLYRFDTAPGWSNTAGHFDVEAIVGGTVNDGHEVFQRMYGTEPEAVDVVIVLGINNVMRNHSTMRITTDINNSAAACPLILPPRLVSFVKPHIIPAWFKNKKDQILAINDTIIQHGRVTSEKVPVYMNTLGVRTDKGGKTSHRRNQWREDEWQRKLHLAPELKAYAALKIAKYLDSLGPSSVAPPCTAAAGPPSTTSPAARGSTPPTHRYIWIKF